MVDYDCKLLSNGTGLSSNRNQDQTDLNTQLVISIALGLSAFLTFCVCLIPKDSQIKRELMDI